MGVPADGAGKLKVVDGYAQLEYLKARCNWIGDFVKATHASGSSLPSTTWSPDVFGKVFLPLARK